MEGLTARMWSSPTRWPRVCLTLVPYTIAYLNSQTHGVSRWYRSCPPSGGRGEDATTYLSCLLEEREGEVQSKEFLRSWAGRDMKTHAMSL